MTKGEIMVTWMKNKLSTFVVKLKKLILALEDEFDNTEKAIEKDVKKEEKKF
jgi:hypothetical protein